MKHGTVADLILYLLGNFDPAANVEVVELIVDVKTQVRVYKSGEPEKKVVSPTFIDSELAYAADADEGDLIYFDYTNPNKGPVTRVGIVLENDGDSILLYDLTVDGPRRFTLDYIEEAHLLT